MAAIAVPAAASTSSPGGTTPAVTAVAVTALLF